MSEHDDSSSVDDAALASAGQMEANATEGGALPSPKVNGGEPARGSRVHQLIREKHAAEALATRSMAESAALRERLQNPGRPQDYRAPEDFTRAVAENAVAKRVGADLWRGKR